jgi:dihydropteroate synthase
MKAWGAPMTTGIYLHPVGLVAGVAARAMLAEGLALPLAGGPLAFAGAFVIEGEPGRTGSRYLDARALAASQDLSDLLGRVTGPRPDFAGLKMAGPKVMGIVNVTPDSFSDGGVHGKGAVAVAAGRAMRAAGADILDIGGESTRPGAAPVSLEEERARILPVIEALAAGGALVSADTRKPALMGEAVAAGAAIINDVSGLTHEAGSAQAAVDTGAAVVLMHMRGDPRTMQDEPLYDDVVLEVFDELGQRLKAARAAGISEHNLAIDPGIGFAKSFGHNLQLMERLAILHGLGVPLLVGASRKGFVGHVTGEKVAARRLPGSLAMALAAAGQGAQMLRVHDVAETVQALAAWRKAAGLANVEEESAIPQPAHKL